MASMEFRKSNGGGRQKVAQRQLLGISNLIFSLINGLLALSGLNVNPP